MDERKEQSINVGSGSYFSSIGVKGALAFWLCGVICGALFVLFGAWLNERLQLLHRKGHTEVKGTQAVEKQVIYVPSYDPKMHSANFLVEAVKRIVPAVVCIRGYASLRPFGIFRELEGTLTELASGVIFDNKNGYIVTNQHVLEGSSRWSAQLIDGRQFKLQKVAEDKRADIAVLKLVGASSLPKATFRSSKDVEVGSWVIAVGNPYGKTHTVTVGVVSAKGRDIRDGVRFIPDVIQTDAPINPGNSGGPLCDVAGRVIGINTAINPQEWGIGYAIASDFVLQAIESMLRRGGVSRPWIGVEYVMLSEDERRQLGIKHERALLVKRVQVNSSAHKAGIMSGDIIVAIDGKEVEDLQHLRRSVSSAGVGGEIKLRIFRGGRYLDITVKIRAMPLERISDESSWR
ncbi:MAG: trypsin-like peptidase domain-containing protein [Armatimonadota bacterium]|nr:trypsin-like peptidase domain-containing protein [Armatimonadota bacterium]MCX7777931.1 trypsin-like peptidase domain-containing protein [Armatimonadota bacterium]MDW8025636.1 trypsin-like peptidase domain-containing protein [Armatimonadota bacterium]